MTLVETFLEILKRPTIWAVIIGMIQFLGPVWIAFLCGVILGWAWRPNRLNSSSRSCKLDVSAPSSPSSSLIYSPVKSFDSAKILDCWKFKVPGFGSSVLNNDVVKEEKVLEAGEDVCSSSSESRKEDDALVTEEDLRYLCHLVERKDRGPPWKHMMDRSTQSMSYQAWQRDPETGPPQYCSRTVYEDATPDMLRDFFWDDEFRLKWDNMLLHAEVLEECPNTGTMMVHWIRKFPFFCSDREYIIGRRIWESGSSYFCVTKGVPCNSLPRKEKPRRVDLYYSSWLIQAVESRNRNGQLSACEVVLFHYEDMGIPWEIAKFGVRQGMWGAVRNIEQGFRAYQKHRASESLSPVSHHVLMARIHTKINPDYLNILEGSEDDSGTTQLVAAIDEKHDKGNPILKILMVGGAILIACSLNRGFMTKTLEYGVARRFGNIGRRDFPRTN